MDKFFFEKVFSTKRMERYFAMYPENEERAILHYECNLMLSESLYTSLSVLEVALRNALCRELEEMTGRNDWYAVFLSTPGLRSLDRYITEAMQHIVNRHETISPSKIIAELTFGFWVSLLNSEYERILWHSLRRAFPFMPRQERQRRNVSTPLNTFRKLRNRIYHNESICWDLAKVEEIHDEMLTVVGWINKDLPEWVRQREHLILFVARSAIACSGLKKNMNLQNGSYF